jgi:chondroitin AC lyase
MPNQAPDWSRSFAAGEADLPRIRRQIAERLAAAPAVKDRRFIGVASKRQGVGGWMQALTPEGAWPDIQYDDKTAGAWEPSRHLVRTLEMAKSYAMPSHELQGDPALRAAIHLALDYWLRKDYRCSNWWHNEIGVPQYVASILILMDQDISKEELERGLAIVARAKIGMTGQNRVWLAGNVLMRGVLEGNAVLVQQGRDAISEEIVITTGEGVQADNSFHQHGRQLQIGNYGLAFATDSVAWMESLLGTGMALSDDKVELLSTYVLQGPRWAAWNGMMDISSCGRQLFPGAQSAKAGGVARIVAALARAGRTVDEDKLIGNKLFWRSDFMVDRRYGYYASVKMSSRRVIGTECVNQENLSGAFLGDGALFVYRTGREYEDLFPVWDWRRLPGVTCRQTADVLPMKSGNTGEFVGGVTDGHDGAAVLDYSRDGLAAKKSWFFFEGQIVCLGAGITAEGEGDVVSSLNQCCLNGAVMAGHDNEVEPVPLGRKTYAALQWAWHDGAGYVFLQPSDVTVGGGAQEGAWTNVYAAGSPAPVAKDVFSIWIDHGSKPHDASYAYVVLPGASEAQVQAYAKTPGAEIAGNTVRLQAVTCGTAAVAVFHAPGRFSYAPGQDLAVDQPCLVMVKETPQGLKVTVADPTQKLKDVNVTCHGKTSRVQLPEGANAGRSVAVP